MFFSFTRTLQFDPNTNPSLLQACLADSLRAARARDVQLAPYAIHFRTGFKFGDRWNVLKCFDSGDLAIDPVAHVVRYHVSFRNFALIMMALLAIPATVGWIQMAHNLLIVEVFALLWLWLVVVNVGIGLFRLHLYFRKAIRNVSLPIPPQSR